MEGKRMGSAILFGVMTIFVIALITSVIFSLLLRFTNLNEQSIQWFVLVLSFLTLFIGGFVSGGKGQSKGWLLGASTGLCYSFIVFLIQFLGYDQLFTAQQFMFHGAFIAVAVLGGVFGVNIASNRQS
ncbi:TIGR04086 family membrane protein [Priestia abyssalis]|uniref:TIGR04086 family membrane protein n=1 Tax=Priestia abyssalis TaxID=1221450 RepID=UPI000994DDF9|nr:TIGR04086 family membrane protein [Priestia abyssalis]